ncbi:hypothetical protein ACQFX9_15030 [Aliinostoc sp. HNIBRCY26]
MVYLIRDMRAIASWLCCGYGERSPFTRHHIADQLSDVGVLSLKFRVLD